MLDFTRRKLRLKVRPRLPADIVGGVGISVDKTPLRRTVNLDFSKLGEAWDTTGMRTVVWNPTTGEYLTAHPDGSGAQPDVWGSVSVDNIGLLRLITPPAVGTVIQVLNHSSDGDLGGGVFVTLDESPGTDDNGIYIDSDTSGTYYKRLILDRIRAEWWGGKGDGTTIDNDAINAGLHLSANSGIPLVLYPRTYLLDAPNSKSPLNTTRYYALDFVSGMSLIGVPGYTILKIKDDISSNTTPKDVNVFVVDDAQTDVTIYGIEFNLNGLNNLINDGRACGGALDITGNDAYVERVFIDRCTFRNGAGSNVIVLGQNENGVAGALSADVRITNCRFIDNGLDTPDFTAVYAWGERIYVDRCLFFQSDSIDRTGRNWVVMELHGSDNYLINSTIQNYCRACWLTSNFTRDARGLYVLNNKIDVWGYGPSLFRELSSMTGVSDVYVERNTIIIRADRSDVVKYGVVINTLYGISEIYVRHNTILADGTGYTAYGCLIGCGTSGQTTRDVYFEHNIVKRVVFGFYARVNDGNGTLTEIHDRFNTYYAMGEVNGTPTSSGSLFSQAGSSVIGRISSVGNRHLGVSDCDRGLYSAGTIAAAFFEGNYFEGVTTELTISASITEPRGKQAMAASYTTANLPSYLTAQDRGLTVYDSTTSKVVCWSGTAWLP